MHSKSHSLPRFHLLPHLPLRYIIVDRHDIVREGVKSLLDDCGDLKCVGQSDGNGVIDLLCRHKPDLLLTGLLLEAVSALAVIRHCRQCMPHMGVIVLSMCSHSLTIAESARAGAHGFVSKFEDSKRLFEVIARVAAGERAVFPPMADLSEPPLTQRERTILRGITRGLSTEEVGHELCISAKTVEAHRTQLLRRFGLRKSTDLVRLALQSGVVSDSGPA